MRLALINPNTSAATTHTMVQIAEGALNGAGHIRGFTARRGMPLITDPRSMAEAEHAVLDLAPEVLATRPDALIIAAFGDPGRAALSNTVSVPITGLAEAGMAEAGAGGRRFAVVTTTPDLVVSIAERAAELGHQQNFAGTWVTEGDPVAVTMDKTLLLHELERACHRALAESSAQALVIGGGPLAVAARALAPRFAVPIIEPIPAAIRRCTQVLAARERA